MTNIFYIQEIIFIIMQSLTYREIIKFSRINTSWNTICTNTLHNVSHDQILRDLNIQHEMTKIYGFKIINIENYNMTIKHNIIHNSDGIVIFLFKDGTLLLQNKNTYAFGKKMLNDTIRSLQQNNIINICSIKKELTFDFKIRNQCPNLIDSLLSKFNELSIPYECTPIKGRGLPLYINMYSKGMKIVTYLFYDNETINIYSNDFNSFFDSYKLFMKLVNTMKF